MPGATDRPGRARLAEIDLAGASSLLTLETRASGGFSLQVKDLDSGEVVRVVRFPPRSRSTEILLALGGESFPGRVRLTLWNHNRSSLEIDGVMVQRLRSGYRWAPILYRILAHSCWLWLEFEIVGV